MLAASIFLIGSIALFRVDAKPLLLSEYAKNFSSRIKRDASDFPSFVDNMAKTARVVTAITVQNGLIDGSMKSDEVLSEMMNVGLASLEDLQSFDVPMVANFVQELTKAVQNLGKDPDLIGIQNDVINMQTIKDKLKDVTDPSDLPDEPQFKQLEALNNLDTGGLEDPNLFNFDDAAKNIRAVAEGHGSMQTVKIDLTTLRDAVKKIDPEKVAYGKLIGTLEKISKLEKYVDLMKYAAANGITDLLNLNEEIIATFKAEFELFEDASSTVTDFESIDSFVSGQMNLVTGSSAPREHAPGFVNGFRDLESLSRDLGDQWLQGNLGTEVKLEGLAPLISMKDKMKQLAEHWEKACTSASLEAIRSAARMKARLENIGTAKANLERVLNTFKGYPQGELKKKAADDTGKLMSASMKAYRKMKALKAVSDEVKQVMTALDAVISGKKDEITTIVKLFDKLKPLFDTLHEKPAIKECYPIMEKYMKYVTNFDQNAMLGAYKAFFKYLEEASDDSKKVAEAMEVLKEVRSLSSSSLQKLTTVANTIAESSTLIAEVRALPKSLKSVSNEETKKLKNLDLRKESKKLGNAVTGVVTIQKAFEKIPDLQKFAHGNTDVKSKVSNLIDWYAKTKIQREWGDFEEVDRQVQLLIKRLEEKTMNVGKAEGSKISAYGPLFEKMIGLRDTDLKTGKRIEALETFIRESKLSTLEEVVIQLRAISLIDLKFSRFDSAYSGISGTLERVGKVLGHSPVKVTSTPIPISFDTSDSPHLNRTDNGTVVGSAAVVAEDSGFNTILVYVGGPVLVVIVIAAVVFGLIACKCPAKLPSWAKKCFKKKGKPKPGGQMLEMPEAETDSQIEKRKNKKKEKKEKPPTVPDKKNANVQSQSIQQGQPPQLQPAAVNNPAPPPPAPVPQNGAPVPPAPVPQNGAPVPPAPVPQNGAPVPPAPAPQNVDPVPPAPAPQNGAPVPPAPVPQNGAPVPPAPVPQNVDPVPPAPAPQNGAPVPPAPVPQNGAPVPPAPVPQNGAPARAPAKQLGGDLYLCLDGLLSKPPP